jgi:hypothetical protein
MALPATGALKFTQIQSVFGGANPISFSEYYLNAATGYTTGTAGIPNIGTKISVSNFYGKSKGAVVPAPVQTNFAGTYLLGGNGSTNFEWVTGCSGTNSSRTGVSTFNNIGTQGRNRAGLIYYPNLILQARAGDTIVFTVNVATAFGDTENIQAFVNLGAGYFGIGNVVRGGGGNLTVNYVIPAGTPAGNYALAGINDWVSGGGYRSISAYSLHIY